MHSRGHGFETLSLYLDNGLDVLGFLVNLLSISGIVYKNLFLYHLLSFSLCIS